MRNEQKTDIGWRIKVRRQALGLTQEELADRLEYKSKAAISRIESGANDVSQSKLVKFADALQCSTSYLLGIDTSPFSFNEVVKTEDGNEEREAQALKTLIYSRLDALSVDGLTKAFDLIQLVEKWES